MSPDSASITSSGSDSPAPVVRKKPKKIPKTKTAPAPVHKPEPPSLASDSTEDLGRALEPATSATDELGGVTDQAGGLTEGLTDQAAVPKLNKIGGKGLAPPKLGGGPGGRRKAPQHMAKKEDEPVEKGEDKNSLRIKIELDLEVEVELWARVKGDVTIGLL